MSSLNVTKIIGVVGKDVVYAGEGKKPFATFDVAVNETFTSKGENGEKVTNTITDWFKVQCFGDAAKLVKLQEIGKGDQVFVSGKLKPSPDWTDKDGKTYKSYHILAYEAPFLIRKKAEGQDATAEE